MGKYVFDHANPTSRESKLAGLEKLVADHAEKCKFIVVRRSPGGGNMFFLTDNLTQEEKDALISYLSS